MKFSKALKKLENINDAQLIMGTDANKKFLIQMGLKDIKIVDAAPLDLIIYMESESDLSEEDIILMVEEVMSKTASTTSSLYEPSSIEGALKTYRDLNLALISVPGQYAAWEALNALRNDLHVMIFSDNVSLEDEIRLKTLGREKGLLVMGPDCGTSIINNIPLGFANRTNKGGVGLVSASGTGLQAVTAMVHNLGGGISQAIGTGGRDLSKEVGGITMLMGLDALMADESTKIIVLISKSPASEVADKIFKRASEGSKPVIIYFIGENVESPRKGDLYFPKNLSHCAIMAVAQEKYGSIPDEMLDYSTEFRNTPPRPDTGLFIRGLYTGGTLADEAISILASNGVDINTNLAHKSALPVKDPLVSEGHCIIDLGDDFFTRGKAHPMIDPASRQERLQKEIKDPHTAVILLDIVLGDGAHEDMVGALTPALSGHSGKIICAFVLGTDLDIQDMASQLTKLKELGVFCFESHSDMVEFASKVVGSWS